MGNATLVRELKRRLGDRGVVVTVQPAITTTSVYLSFDYGVLKQARVGDHKGKGYHFKYEIGQHIPNYEALELSYEGTPWTRYRYPADQIGDLVQEILILRSNMWSKYTKEGYDKIVARKKAA